MPGGRAGRSWPSGSLGGRLGLGVVGAPLAGEGHAEGLEQLKEENPEAYAKPEPEEGEEGEENETEES